MSELVAPVHNCIIKTVRSLSSKCQNVFEIYCLWRFANNGSFHEFLFVKFLLSKNTIFIRYNMKIQFYFLLKKLNLIETSMKTANNFEEWIRFGGSLLMKKDCFYSLIGIFHSIRYGHN